MTVTTTPSRAVVDVFSVNSLQGQNASSKHCGMSSPTLHEFIRELEDTGTHYMLTPTGAGAVVVQVALPGERWEVEFFEDQEPEAKVFRSDGTVFGIDRIPVLRNKQAN